MPGIRWQGMSRRTLAHFILVASLVLVQIWQDGAPAVVGRDAPADEFSSLRALDHLAQLAVAPHPMGSPANRRVADHIEERVRAMGLEVERQPGRIVRNGPSPMLADLENLLVRLPGTDNTRALLLTAHYDSVPGSFGASDDGAGVATLLECLRVLKASPPLRNDVLFLFTDGEEFGLLGAQDFVRDAGRLADIGVVMNFEGRGNRGPVWLFETSSPNEWVVRQFAEGSPFPVGNSLSYEIYKRLPNDTDFSVFKRQGLPGFNFAHFGGITGYHTRLDSLANLDQASLQHHGSYAVALSRRLGEADLSRIDPGGELIYGNLVGNVMVYYSRSWVFPGLIVAWAILVAAIVVASRRLRLTRRGFWAGLATQLVLLLVGPIAVFGLWRLIWWFHPQRQSLVFGQPYGSKWWMMGLLVAGGVLCLLGMRPWLRRWPGLGVPAGVVTASLLFTTLFCWIIPGSHFLLFWPALGAVLALLIRSMEGPRPGWSGGLGLAAAAVPACLLPALAGQLHEALTLNLVAVPAVVMIFFLGTLNPLFSDYFQNPWLPRLGLAGAAGLFFLALLSGTFTPDRPGANSLAYALLEGADAGTWVSTDRAPDEWTRNFLGTPQMQSLDWLSPLFRRPLLTSPAPSVPLPGIEVTVELEAAPEAIGNPRRLNLQVVPGAEGSFLALESAAGTRVLSARVQGLEMAPLEFPDLPWNLRYLAPPVEGVTIELDVQGRGEAVFNLVESRRGWPEALQHSLQRPPEMQSFPYPYWIQDSTLIARQIRIDLSP